MALVQQQEQAAQCQVSQVQLQERPEAGMRQQEEQAAWLLESAAHWLHRLQLSHQPSGAWPSQKRTTP